MLTAIKIGNKIAEARKKNNISQAQLADSLFISPQAVGKWERGESMPDIITFNRLAEILGVDLNYFSDGFQSGPPEPGSERVSDGKEAAAQSPRQKDKPGWDMSRGNWVDADFSGLKNLHEKFSSSNMLRCLFIGSDMSGLVLKRNNVNSCDFSGSEFSGSLIQNSNLADNLFSDCSMKNAEFSESYITGCNFSGTNFTGTVIRSGGLEKCTLSDALWNRTAFIETYLADIILEGKIEDCCFENCAFSRVTFRNATLINTFFKNKTLKRVRFVDCTADRMTYEFLKNGTADLTGVTII